MKNPLRLAVVLAIGLLAASCSTAQLLNLGAAGADTVEATTGPSSPTQLNIFAAEEKTTTILENLAASWAESGTETAAQAASVEAVRVPIDQALADGRKARDNGNNALLAQAISSLKSLTPKLTALLPAAYQPPAQ